MSAYGPRVGFVGTLCISMVFCFIAMPTVYCLMMRLGGRAAAQGLVSDQ